MRRVCPSTYSMHVDEYPTHTPYAPRTYVSFGWYIAALFLVLVSCFPAIPITVLRCVARFRYYVWGGATSSLFSRLLLLQTQVRELLFGERGQILLRQAGLFLDSRVSFW